ncbi:MAG: hypothetical protein JXQ83_02895 [Candidatus Glassbacteria bacterium]|nr:hypothetical protein [Candidatus Glassbacteria bacterium]
MYTQGNNVGLILDVYTQPMNSSTHNSYKQGRVMHSFPRGSGNYYGYLIHSFSPTVSRDCTGDGVPEDTARIYMRGRGLYGSNCTIESYDMLKSLFDQGLVMEVYARDLDHNQMYTSKDAEDLADWPVEFRQGRSPDGEPIVYGAETVVGRYGDCWRLSGIDMPIGVSAEYSWYFLDFGPSNNMVYSHVLMTNVSEYLKWCDLVDVRELVKNTPDGQNWHDVGLCLAKHTQFLEDRGKWAEDAYLYHKGQNISGFMDIDGIVESFIPNTAPVIVEKILRMPSFKGETMENKFCSVAKGIDFGVELVNDYLENSKPPGVMLRAFFGDESLYPGVINIWTGRQTAGGWPGVIQPEDEFYDKWIWGGGTSTGPNLQYVGWGMLHDVAPRDTFSFDWVHMCVPMDEPFEVPPREISYIHDELIQEHLKPVEEYGEAALAVYQSEFILPETPAAPPLTIIPGDRQVTVTWSDINLKTPDRYYYFLQENDLDPNGLYHEYDFEGFRLYRSYVGPNDSHSELIFECSLSANNVQCFYVDRLEDDINYSRMRNGLKVWYALVPYDKNFDVLDGVEFSLPDASSGKTWNRPSNSPGLYNLMPRSEASNFKPADIAAISYMPSLPGTVVALNNMDLAGDGNGRLLDDPVILQPLVEFVIEPVIAEKITQDMTLYLECYGMEAVNGNCGNRRVSSRSVRLVDTNGSVIDDSPPDVRVRYEEEVSSVFSHISDDGATYGLYANFSGLAVGELHYQIDLGGYSGGTVAPHSYRCNGKLPAVSEPSNPGYALAGKYTITWKSAASGGLTLEVKDLARGVDLPFSPWMGTTDRGWGLITPVDLDRKVYDEDGTHVPFAERQYLMLETIPAENVDKFAVYVNGICWEVDPAAGAETVSMPAAGTVWTAVSAFGEWNSDLTSFKQYPDPFWVGDKWKIEVKATTIKDEDIDLQKIRVVPNPYICSSFLDLSPSNRRIEFINLPDRCTIRIFTLSGNLVNVLNHIGASRLGWGNYTDWDALSDNEPRKLTGWDNHSGTEAWNLRTRFGSTVSSGLYFYHVTDARGETYTGKFYIIN